MKKINQILTDTVNSNTVNSRDNNINTVNGSDSANEGEMIELEKSFEEQLDELLSRNAMKEESKADLLAEILNDKDSIPWYRILVKENNFSLLLDLAHQTKERYDQGKISAPKGAYFSAILRRRGIKAKFKKK